MYRLINPLLILLTFHIFTSCSYVATYSIGLSKVECPANAKHEFGETKIIEFKHDGISKYRYEDDYIDIVWFVSSTQFNFELRNKSVHTIKINWDDISYVDINSNTGRVMHSGVKYIDRNNSQPPTSIPKNASISDNLLPTDNVYYISGEYGGWKEKYLLPCSFKTKEEYNLIAPTNVGKKMSILMPIMIENIKNDYIFEFVINELIQQPKHTMQIQ